MLPSGHKLTVIASPANKGRASIKKGSEGYIVSTSHKVRNLSPNGGHSLVDSIRILPARIIFTRFGKETKRRSELKPVTLVYPTIDPKNLKNPGNYLKKLTKRVLDSSDRIRNMFQSEGLTIKHINPVVAHTINPTENVLSSKNEFVSWSRSILMCPYIVKVLFSMPNSAHSKLYNELGNNSTKIKHSLRMSTSSRKIALKYLEDLYLNNEEETLRLTAQFRKAMHLSQLHEADRLNKVFDGPGLLFNYNTIFQTAWAIRCLGMESIYEDTPNPTGAFTSGKAISDSWYDVFNKLAK